jgi:formyl-CoA transferase
MAALDGLRVLDMTQYEAGTSCTQALAFLGADVVKIEQPVTGEPGRRLSPTNALDSEYFLAWNSNKRSVTLDLGNARGRQLLLDLVPHYDVFVENYGPGVIEKLDIGYETMRAVHPQIIYVRIKGFGTSGPYAGYKCMDMVAQAAAGAFSVTGDPDGPPVRPGVTMGDSGTGVQAALAVTAAYVEKLRTGKGQLIELSMQEAMTYYLRTAISRTQFGKVPTPRGRNGENPFVALYPCAPGGANDYVFIMASNARMWAALCRAIGQPDLLADPRFATAADRRAHHAELFDVIASWTRQRGKQQAMHELARAGISASAVYETSDLFTDPHLLSRGFVQEVEHAAHGRVRMLRWPARMATSPVPMRGAPRLGEHSAQVLAADLGLDTEAIEALRRDGAVGSERYA